MTMLHRSTPAELKARLDAERAGAPFVVYRDGDGRQRMVPLTGVDRVSIGRQPASDVPLPWDEEVSRAHAELQRIGDVWTLVDDGRSRNGSFVNGERVRGRRTLRGGDVARLGRTTLEFVQPLATGARSTAVSVSGLAPPVSPAQRRVLVALCRPFADGRFAAPPSNAELAGELHLSVDTVKLHLRALFAAFRIDEVPQHRKRATLARLALELRVVEPDELPRP